MPLRDIWPEIWDQIGPMLAASSSRRGHVAGGPAAVARAQRLPRGGLLHVLVQPDPRRVRRGRRRVHRGAPRRGGACSARGGCRRSPSSARRWPRRDERRSRARRRRARRGARGRAVRGATCSRGRPGDRRGLVRARRTQPRDWRGAAETAVAGERCSRDGARRPAAGRPPGRLRARPPRWCSASTRRAARRRLPRLLPRDRAPAVGRARERRGPRGRARPAPTSWPSSTGRRRSSSPTSRTSSARR